jgi:hypothetical protein
MEITPEQAERWLEEANLKNRTLGERSSDRIAHDIKRNNFRLTHQGIAFDTDNVLVDGQHRLRAIVNAKKPVTMFVCFGLSPDCRMFIDAGKQRSFSDVASFKFGEGVNPRVASTARTMMDPFFEFNYSRYEQVLFYEKHKAAIHSAIDMFRGAQSEVTMGAVIGVFGRAIYTQQLEPLVRFVDILKDPVTANVRPIERAAVTLREDLIRMRSEGGRNRRLIYRRVEYLLMCFLNKNHKPARKGIADSEFFPIPGESGFRKQPKAA